MDQKSSKSLPIRPSWKALFTFTTRRHMVLLLCAFSTSSVNGVITPVGTIFVGRIFQSFTDYDGGQMGASQFRHVVSQNVLILTGLAAITWISSTGLFVCWIVFGELQARSARLQLFDGLLEKPTVFYDSRATGVKSLSPRLQTQIRELQTATSQPLGNIAQYIASAIVSLVIALIYSWSLTLLLLGILPFSAAILSYISNRMQKHVDNQVEQLAIAMKYSTAAFANIETVKCYNGQSFEYTSFAKAIKKAKAFYIKQVQGNALQMGYMKFSTLITFMVGFYYASHLVSSDKSSTADVITTFFSCVEVAQSIQEVLSQMIVLEKGRSAGAALCGFAQPHLPSDLAVLKETVIPADLSGDIVFANVSFAYPAHPDTMVLRGLSCTFPKNRLTFVIGRSGSGKTTISQLLLRFYSPKSGRISLGNVPLQSIDVRWLRQHFTLVEQQSVLFDGTVHENIALARDDHERVTIQDVKDAAGFALLTSAINDMSEGMDTLVGSKGSSLSGGQVQRVALARARIRDTPILILDESTSALDQVSRTLIMAAIRTWRCNRTTIIISHDMSSIEAADYIHLFEHGRVVASGYRSSLEAERNEAFLQYLPQARAMNRAENMKDCSRDTPLDIAASRMQHGKDPWGVSAIQQARTTTSNGSHKPFSPLLASGGFQLGPFGLISPRASIEGFTNKTSTIDKFKPLPLLPFASLPSSPKESSISNDASSIDSILNGEEIELLGNSGSRALNRRARHDKPYKTDVAMFEKNRDVPGLGRTNPRKTYDGQDGIWHSKSNASLTNIVSTIWPHLHRKAKLVLILSAISLSVHSASIPLFSWIFSKMIATFSTPNDTSQMALRWSMAMLALSVIDGLMVYILHVGLEFCSQVWVDAVRLQAMQRIIDQPKHFFSEEGNDPSSLAYCLDRNAEEMRNILGRFVAFIFVAMVMYAIAATWSVLVCWKLALVGFALTPLSWLSMRCFQIVSSGLEHQCNDAGEATGAVLNEAITNISTVRALTLEALFRTKHSRAAAQTFRIGLRRAFYSGFFFGVSETFMSFINCLVFFYGCLLVASNQCSVEAVLLVFTQLMFALGNITAIMAFIPQIASSKDTAVRLLNMAHLPKDSHENDGSLRPLRSGDIVLRNVSFSYTNQPPATILHNLNLTFPHASTTAIVGPSGSGKSTIAALLLRLYPVTSKSSITMAGQPLCSISTPHLRTLITLIPQTPVLFPTTVTENITYGLLLNSPFNTPSMVREAAIAAGIHEFVMSLPLAYETVIGDGGLGLSGGQAQRICIARALVRQPQVLILDEATSGLDGRSIEVVMDSLKGLKSKMSDMTIIIITHERRLMEIADGIIVVEGGRVVEQGAFEELMDVEEGRLRALLCSGVWTG